MIEVIGLIAAILLIAVLVGIILYFSFLLWRDFMSVKEKLFFGGTWVVGMMFLAGYIYGN